MGLAATQARMLGLTQRIHKNEYKLMNLTSEQLKKTRETQKLESEYVEKMNAAVYTYENKFAEFANVSYDDLMGKGAIKSTRFADPAIITHSQTGKVVLSYAVANEIRDYVDQNGNILDGYYGTLLLTNREAKTSALQAPANTPPGAKLSYARDNFIAGMLNKTGAGSYQGNKPYDMTYRKLQGEPTTALVTRPRTINVTDTVKNALAENIDQFVTLYRQKFGNSSLAEYAANFGNTGTLTKMMQITSEFQSLFNSCYNGPTSGVSLGIGSTSGISSNQTVIACDNLLFGDEIDTYFPGLSAACQRQGSNDFYASKMLYDIEQMVLAREAGASIDSLKNRQLEFEYKSATSENVQVTAYTGVYANATEQDAKVRFYGKIFDAIVKAGGYVVVSGIEDRKTLQAHLGNNNYLIDGKTIGELMLSNSENGPRASMKLAIEDADENDDIMAWYKSETQKLKNEEKEIQYDITSINAKLSALYTEKESLNSILQKNLEKSFVYCQS